MANGLLYVCKACGKWMVVPTAMTLNGCLHCKGELHYVPINMDQYNGWSEEIQRAFQQNYLAGRYTNGEPPFPGAKPAPVVAQSQRKQAPVQQTPQKQPKQKKSAGCGAAFLSIILRVVVGIVIFFLFTGGANFLSRYNGLQRTADTSLNTLVRVRLDPVVGSYVSLNVRWVLGPFAEETSTYTYSSRYSSSGSGLTSTVSEMKYFYVVLDDGTVMALATTNAKEIETLERMSLWLSLQNGFPDGGESITVQGEVKQMSSDIRNYYDQYLNSYGLASGTPNIRYVVLDTTAGREMIYIIVGGVALVLVLILVISSIRKKKKKKAAAAA